MIEVLLPVAVPLAAGILALPLRRGSGAVPAAATAASLVASAAVLRRAAGGEVLVYALGGWRPPFGIVLVGDALSGLMVTLSSLVFLAVVLGTWNRFDRVFYSLVLFTMTGVNGAFLTGDLFNLFVWFEVMLISSYVLVAYRGGWSSVASFRYLAMNLVGSSLMLLGIGGVYRATGTLNMAQLGRATASGEPSFLLLSAALLLFLAFALKAGSVPLHFWVAETYAEAPAPVTALLSGVVKKVGVYGVVRLAFFALPVAADPVLTAAMVLGAVSVFYGGVLAQSQRSLDRLLANSSIAQVGFMFFGVGLGSAAGLFAGLVAVVAHGLAKPLLFVVSEALERGFGSPEIAAMGGASRSRFLSGAFLVGGFSLVGIPPLIGFFAKLFLLEASLEPPALLWVAVPGSVLTVLYVSRVWTEAFWGAPREFDGERYAGYVTVALLGVAVVAAGVAAEPVVSWVDAAVQISLDPEMYYAAVLEGSE